MSSERRLEGAWIVPSSHSQPPHASLLKHPHTDLQCFSLSQPLIYQKTRVSRSVSEGWEGRWSGGRTSWRPPFRTDPDYLGVAPEVQ